MGWKNLKEYFKIDWIVQVCDGMILIGSEYVSDLIKIDREFTISTSGWTRNQKIANLFNRLINDREKVRSLILEPDKFGPLTTVYTYTNSAIVEKQCETVGYPNVCTDGELQCENIHSTDRSQVVEWAIKAAQFRIKLKRERVDRLQEELAEAKAQLIESENNLALLIRDKIKLIG